MDSGSNFRISLAGRVIEISCLFGDTKKLCKDYICNGEPDFCVSVSREDIEAEREVTDGNYRDGYLETLAVYRKICTGIAKYGTVLIHGSALAVGNEAVLFTAVSGTGKTTHSRLWIKNFSDCVIVNGDKPLVSIDKNGASVHGTPWCGKEGYNKNISAPLKSIVLLRRGETNSVSEISASEAFPEILSQMYIPKHSPEDALAATLFGKLMNSVKSFRMFCNMEDEAAYTAREALYDD